VRRRSIDERDTKSQKARSFLRALLRFRRTETLEVHIAHAAARHSAAARHAARFLLRTVGNHGLRRDQERCDRGCILQRGAHDLGRIDNTGFDAQSESYVDLIEEGIIDPTKVVRIALQNAASVAALLITTEAMVADRPKRDSAPAMPGGGMGDMDY